MTDIPARLAEASRSLGILAAQARAAVVLADDLTAHADDIDLGEAPC